MHRWIITAAALLALTGCAATPAAAPTTIGQPDVYQRISNTTDCAELQAEFDTAEQAHQRAQRGSTAAAIAVSYMEAANTRMTELGCYK